MSNEQMKAGRFLRWHKARQRIAYIIKNLEAGNVIVIATATRAIEYRKSHITMFKATKSGSFVQSGKSWNCIDYCNIKAFA